MQTYIWQTAQKKKKHVVWQTFYACINIDFMTQNNKFVV